MREDSRLLSTGLYWNQVKVGDRFKTHRRTVTETDLVQFVNLTWLTEEMFTNATSAEDRILQGRIVPGALVYCFAEGLVLPMIQDTGLAFLGAEITVNLPTLVGDTVHVDCEVIESRLTTRPGRGLVRTLNRVIRQSGEVVMTYSPVRLIRERPAGG
jgi:acyl dehydratase